MSKKQIFFGLIAALAMAGCSSDDNLTNSDNTMISDGTPRYMKVSLVANSEGGTRANDPVFENGTDEENAIKKVRFYFFTDDGNVAAVKADGTNYFDCTPTVAEQTTGNVEEILETTVVIQTKEGDRIPSKMIAVINPDDAGLSTGNLSMAQVRGTTLDYAALANADNSSFVMANSVYRDGSMERISTSRITSENITDDATAVEDCTPVEVYVERCVGKVAMQYSSNVETTSDGLVVMKDKEGNAITISKGDGTEAEQVYLKVLGWDLTANTTQSYLSKHINTEWGDALLSASDPWTSVTNHRSYWAQNILSGTGGMTGTDESGIQYYSFNSLLASHKDIAAAGATLAKANWKYTNENAGSDYTSGRQRTYPTQMIIFGQIVDAEGNPCTISEYLGAQHIEADENCEKLKTTIAGVLASVYYAKTTEGTDEVYTSIQAEDLDLESVSIDVANPSLTVQNETGRYKVKVKLSDTGLQKTWCTSNEKSAPTISTTDLNTALSAYTASVWKTGYTYYSTKINHIATEDVGMYGIVRNHYYKATISGIYGLGTPVYDPSKVIYPEETEDEDSYIAAKINILAWRVISKEYEFGK